MNILHTLRLTTADGWHNDFAVLSDGSKIVMTSGDSQIDIPREDSYHGGPHGSVVRFREDDGSQRFMARCSHYHRVWNHVYATFAEAARFAATSTSPEDAAPGSIPPVRCESGRWFAYPTGGL